MELFDTWPGHAPFDDVIKFGHFASPGEPNLPGQFQIGPAVPEVRDTPQFWGHVTRPPSPLLVGLFSSLKLIEPAQRSYPCQVSCRPPVDDRVWGGTGWPKNCCSGRMAEWLRQQGTATAVPQVTTVWSSNWLCIFTSWKPTSDIHCLIPAYMQTTWRHIFDSVL